MLRKWISFDEPASKSALLRKAISRKQNIAARIDAPEKCQEEEALDKEISQILAFEDLKLFRPLAYDTWFAGLKSELRQNNDSIYSPPAQDILDKLLNGSRKNRLQESEIRWLDFYIESSPSWGDFRVPGPWSLDARINSILNLRSILQEKDCHFLHKFEIWQNCLKESREQLPGNFHPRVILLVEGQTESIMLPAFARSLSRSLSSMACDLQACGGAKQVAKRFLNLRELTNLPIVVLLDADVEEPREIIADSLRSQDRLLILESGEIEDTFEHGSFLRILNSYLREAGFSEQLAESSFGEKGKRAANTDKILRARGLGGFDKIAFAEEASRILKASELPAEIRQIITTIEESSNNGEQL